MAASTNKKALVARFDKGPLEGFVQLPEGLTSDGLDVLSPDGALARVAPQDIRAICFIREFGEGETWSKHRVYQSRPKHPGLWVRVKFRDGEQIEGVMLNNLAAEADGFSIVPPDPTFQNQRIWVPRSATAVVEVLGVIGSPLRRTGKAKPASPDADKQIEMFS